MDDEPGQPSMVYQVGGDAVDPRPFVNYPVVLFGTETPQFWCRIKSATIGNIDLPADFNDGAVNRSEAYFVQFLATDEDATQGVTFPLRDVSDGQNPPDSVPNSAALRTFKARLDRATGVYIVRSPGQLDSDNVRQPELPTGWAAVPNHQAPDYEQGTFLCFDRYVEPAITGGIVEQSASGANTVTVSIPSLPAKTIVTGVCQGLEFDATNANNKLEMDSDAWVVSSARQLDRERYEVVLEKRESADGV